MTSEYLNDPLGSREPEPPEPEDICGLCGEPGAYKIPHPIHWPGEQTPDTDLVHPECEQAECARAHREFMAKEGKAGVDRFLRTI